jgi:hypothetical protein
MFAQQSEKLFVIESDLIVLRCDDDHELATGGDAGGIGVAKAPAEEPLMKLGELPTDRYFTSWP